MTSSERGGPSGRRPLDIAAILKDIPVLKMLDGHEIGRLTSASELLKFAAGETIIREHYGDRALFFIIQGQVAVYKNNVKLCEMRRMGDFFGEINIIDNRTRSATVLARKDTICLKVDMDAIDLEDIQGNSQVLAVIYRAFAEVLAERLRRMNDELLYLRQQVTRLTASARFDKEKRED